MMHLQNMKEDIGADTISKRGNVITVRRSFFYTHGRTTEQFVEAVKAAVPGAKVLDSGEVWKNFRGGASIAQGSHWFVKFELPAPEPEDDSDCSPAGPVS